MKHFDLGSTIVILITLVLFIAALFFKGFTHDLLLEAAVFLVSVKLIISAYKASITTNEIIAKLNNIHADIIRFNKINGV